VGNTQRKKRFWKESDGVAPVSGVYLLHREYFLREYNREVRFAKLMSDMLNFFREHRSKCKNCNTDERAIPLVLSRTNPEDIDIDLIKEIIPNIACES